MPEIYSVPLNDSATYANQASNDVWKTFANAAMSEFDRARTKREALETEQRHRADTLSDEQRKNAQNEKLYNIQYGNIIPDGKGGWKEKPVPIDWKAMNEKAAYMRDTMGIPAPKDLASQRDKLVTEMMLAGEKDPNTKKPLTVAQASDRAAMIQRKQYPHVSDTDWAEYAGWAQSKARASDIGDAKMHELYMKRGKDFVSNEIEGGADWIKNNDTNVKPPEFIQKMSQQQPQNRAFGTILPRVAGAAGGLASNIPGVVNSVGKFSENIGAIPSATLAFLPQMAKAASQGMANNPFAGTALRNQMLTKSPAAMRALASMGGTKAMGFLAGPAMAIPSAAMTGYQIGSAIERPVNDFLHDNFVNMINHDAYKAMLEQRAQDPKGLVGSNYGS